MSAVQPYGNAPRPPLSGGARFIRGFKRIGLVLGLLVAIPGVIGSSIYAFNQQSLARARFEQASCVYDRVRNKWPIKMKSYDSSKIDFDATGCPNGPLYYENIDTVSAYARQGPPAPLEAAIEPFSWGVLFSLIGGAIFFYGFWVLGWLFAGFTRD
jgi:hypothetical protein